jgi:glycosyltransferase involved in cell wall biosynthesis
LRICFIGKHPPIQGGVSRENFWASYALAQEGFDVHVVTNAEEVEYQFRTLQHSKFALSMANALAQAKGSLTIHSTSHSRRHSYIPWTNPFVTKLATLATEVIEAYDCDLIYSYYFEPYALAAKLASQWTHIPYGIRHAGSDVGRLLQCQDLRIAYERTIQSADYVFAARSTFRRFLQLGIDFDKLYFPVRDNLPTEYFHPFATPLDINELREIACSTLPESWYHGVFHKLLHKTFDPALPTIGIYGKVGEVKGSFDLLRALSKLRSAGMHFNFLALTQGHPQSVLDFARGLEEHHMEEVTWLLPFIPHWCIPQFIRACTAICFLERDFPIKIHQPTVPREVFACGTCLVLSHEIANKQLYNKKLQNGTNVLLVDPLNIDELAATLRTVIEQPDNSQKIGMSGYHDISAGTEDFAAYSRNLAAAFTTIRQDVELRRKSMSLAEMQAYLARLYVDDSFRKLFDLATDATLDEYKLTEEEIHALKSIDRHLLNRFALSLKAKRKEKFRKAYPLTFDHPAIDSSRYYDRFYDLYPARPHESTLSHIQDFGEFLEQCLATDEDAPHYASELAKYEQLCHSTAYTPSPQDSFATLNETHEQDEQQAKTPFNLTARPFLLPGVRSASFVYNIVAIANALQEQHEPEDLKAGHYYFVFQQLIDSLSPTIFSISHAAYELLMLCDGSHTITTLVHEMEQCFQKDHLEGEITHLIQHLYSLNVAGVAV